MLATTLSESLSSLLAATVAFAIGTSVVLRDRKREQFVLFAVFCFNLGLYHLARFFYGFSGVELFGWFAQIIALGLPWSADACFSGLVPAAGPRPGARVVATLGTLMLLVHVIGLALPQLTTHTSWEIVPIAVAVYVVGGLLYAATRMWRAARAAEGTAVASRLRYLYYASLIALALGLPIVAGVGPIVTAVYLYFVAQTLTRERLLDLPEVAGRILAMSALVVVVTTLYALLLSWIPARAGGQSLFLFNAAVASFAVIVLIDPVRTEIESRIEGWLFRDRPVLRSMLLQLRHKLVNVIDPDEMVQVVIEELRASNRVTRVSLYLLDRQGMGLVLRGNIGPAGPSRLDLATRRPLLDRMRLHGSVLRDVLQRERERSETQAELDEMLETLASLGASLALPVVGYGGERARASALMDTHDLLGALFVDDERLLEPFSREEVALFEGVVAQAAITLQNSAVYEARKERDRLAALGEMAAGLAHEIRNPLGSIKGAAQVLEPTRGRLDEHTREFLDVIIEEVDRLNRVVSQFLTYSRPFTGEMSSVSIAEVIGATVRLLHENARQRVTIEELPTELPCVRGDGEALRQVLHNLVLNALDATSLTKPPGRVWLTATLRRRALRSGDAIAVAVRDNGPGLSPHTMSNLFVPFHTTKTGGTGLGLPITQRIVENHQGVIEVANEADGGARFTVILPVEDDTPTTRTGDFERIERPLGPGTASRQAASHGSSSTAPSVDRPLSSIESGQEMAR